MRTPKEKAHDYISKISQNDYEIFDAEMYACLHKIWDLIADIQEKEHEQK